MEQVGKITIGIDASGAAKEHISGIEGYAREVIKELTDLNDKGDFRVTLYTTRFVGFFKKLPQGVIVKILGPRRLWSQLGLAWESFRHPQSVLFIPSHVIPFLCRGKAVITIHDLGFKHYPELYPTINRWYHNITTAFAVRRADHIITVSEFTKQDILRSYSNIKPSKITAVLSACNTERFYPLSDKDKTPYRDKWGEYVLFLGRLEYKKNIEGIVRSYILLRQQHKTKHKLVLAGRPKYGFEKVRELIDSLPTNIRNDIVITGYLNEEDVPRILRESSLFLFPTFFEGFGLPILEAFASGIPVVTSNTTSLPEVSGNAALLVNPKKPQEIADACWKVLSNAGLCQELIEKGKKRVSEFSWRKTAQKTLNILLEVARDR